MGYITKENFKRYVDRSLSFDAWMFFELTNLILTNEYRKLMLDDLRFAEEHRLRIIKAATPKMVEVNIAAAEIDVVPQELERTDMWKARIDIPIDDPHHVIGCTTFEWESRYGTQRFREVIFTSTETTLTINLKVRGLQRARIDEAVAALLSALQRRLSDIAARIDEYIAALPYTVRIDLMVLPSQLREEARQAA